MYLYTCRLPVLLLLFWYLLFSTDGLSLISFGVSGTQMQLLSYQLIVLVEQQERLLQCSLSPTGDWSWGVVHLYQLQLMWWLLEEMMRILKILILILETLKMKMHSKTVQMWMSSCVLMNDWIEKRWAEVVHHVWVLGLDGECLSLRITINCYNADHYIVIDFILYLTDTVVSLRK